MKHGFLNIDKPAGWTSHDVVAKVRSLLKIKKVGHLGTLDPMATGVLPLCFGKGTKLASLLAGVDKTYEAVLRLGQETDTEDASGAVVSETEVPERLRGTEGVEIIAPLLESFLGDYEQVPPMYSALKLNGERLYKAARRGEVLDRPSRTVKILEIAFLGLDGADVSFRVRCSKGTYIRTLCSDLGKKCGVGAHMLSLRRTAAGPFEIKDSMDIDDFARYCADGNWSEYASSLESELSCFPTLRVKEKEMSRLLNGVQIGPDGIESWEAFEKGSPLCFVDREGKLLAVGEAEVTLAGAEAPAAQGGLAPYRIKTVLPRESQAPQAVRF